MTKTCILLLVLVATALGQTSADLSARYPQIAAYKVHPDVEMTARFSGDGQVCEMTLEKIAETDSRVILGASFSLEELRTLVDDLVPEDLRGPNLTKGRFNGSIEGISFTTEYTYENVLVRAYGIRGAAGYQVIIITWPKRPCGEARTAVR